MGSPKDCWWNQPSSALEEVTQEGRKLEAEAPRHWCGQHVLSSHKNWGWNIEENGRCLWKINTGLGSTCQAKARGLCITQDEVKQGEDIVSERNIIGQMDSRCLSSFMTMNDSRTMRDMQDQLAMGMTDEIIFTKWQNTNEKQWSYC